MARSKIFEMVTRLAPDYAEGWNRLATSLYYRGLNADALGPTQQTLALEPRHYGAIWGIAMIHRSLGQEDMARRYFQLALPLHRVYLRRYAGRSLTALGHHHSL